MNKYIMSVAFGTMVGFLVLGGSSCVKKTETAVVSVDGGMLESQPPVITGVMTTEPPTISSVPEPVNPQITDSVTQQTK